MSSNSGEKKPLRLGILGLSEGNGHPYSWSAIFNGYDPEAMQACPFPVIPEYLARQQFPRDQISGAHVTHIWTQERAISERVARAAKISEIVNRPEDMIGAVDAVLLARDDAETHYEMSEPFLRAGLSIFIDKPLATRVDDAQRMLQLEKFPGQLFSCSALRYADELLLSEVDQKQLKRVRLVDAIVGKSWAKYAVHLIEPTLQALPNRGALKDVRNTGRGEIQIVTVSWANDVQAVFKVVGAVAAPLALHVYGEGGYRDLVFRDSFAAFKKSLMVFVDVVRQPKIIIPRAETLEIVEIIERGQG